MSPKGEAKHGGLGRQRSVPASAGIAPRSPTGAPVGYDTREFGQGERLG